MDVRDFFLAQHSRIHTRSISGSTVSYQDNMLRGTTHDDIRAKPGLTFNSMAWILWHLTRGEDITVAIIIGQRPQVFDEGDWATKLGIDRRDLGTAMNDDEVDTFTATVDIDSLLAYRALVGTRSREIVQAMHVADLDAPITREMLQISRDQGAFGPGAEFVPERWVGHNKAFTLAHSVLAHAAMHFGQGETIRRVLGLETI
jgi:hypothetical protein